MDARGRPGDTAANKKRCCRSRPAHHEGTDREYCKTPSKDGFPSFSLGIDSSHWMANRSRKEIPKIQGLLVAPAIRHLVVDAITPQHIASNGLVLSVVDVDRTSARRGFGNAKRPPAETGGQSQAERDNYEANASWFPPGGPKRLAMNRSSRFSSIDKQVTSEDCRNCLASSDLSLGRPSSRRWPIGRVNTSWTNISSAPRTLLRRTKDSGSSWAGSTRRGHDRK
jgi:hypothetical protein